jgi:hypothetical protein
MFDLNNKKIYLFCSIKTWIVPIFLREYSYIELFVINLRDIVNNLSNYYLSFTIFCYLNFFAIDLISWYLFCKTKLFKLLVNNQIFRFLFDCTKQDTAINTCRLVIITNKCQKQCFLQTIVKYLISKSRWKLYLIEHSHFTGVFWIGKHDCSTNDISVLSCNMQGLICKFSCLLGKIIFKSY